MKKLLTALAVGALAVALAGCVPAKHNSSAPAAAPAEKPAAAAEPSFAPPASAEPKPEVAKFDTAWTYTDGVSISVSAPVEFSPSRYAVSGTQPHNVKVNFTITNGSSKVLQPMPYATVSSGGAEAQEVYDSEQGLNSGPSAPVLPGGTITWAEGYNVADPASIILQVAPSFDYEKVIFATAQ
jgi:hypothetical protein